MGTHGRVGCMGTHGRVVGRDGGHMVGRYTWEGEKYMGGRDTWEGHMGGRDTYHRRIWSQYRIFV